MIIKATLGTLLLILVVVIAVSYYVNKEGFDDISNGYLSSISNDLGSAIKTVSTDMSDSKPRVVVNTQVDGIFLNINANTTDGSTVYGAKILYNSTVPVLSVGQTTDSALAMDLVIPPTSFTIYNKPLSDFKNGFKYYIVPSTVSKYVEGATPLLGSFVFNKDATPSATPTPSVTPMPAPMPSPSSIPTTPKRTDVIPEVTISGSGYNAMTLQQKAELLKDIQKLVKNEVLANRSTRPIISGETRKSPDTDCTAQGKEYEESCYKDNETRCPKNPDGTCPPVPDMTQYIRKDAIPCWGCSLDY
jgi:hypothetical protein